MPAFDAKGRTLSMKVFGEQKTQIPVSALQKLQGHLVDELEGAVVDSLNRVNGLTSDYRR